MKILNYSNITNINLIGEINGKINQLLEIIQNRYSIINEQETDEKEQIKDHFHGFEDMLAKYMSANKLSKKAYDEPHTLFIVAGNCYFGNLLLEEYLEIFTKINNILQKYDSSLLIMRGNGDKSSYFSNHLIDLSNVKLIEDYSIILTKHYNFLCIGGSLTLNRQWLKNNADEQQYWEDEIIQYDAEFMNFIQENNLPIHCVITNEMDFKTHLKNQFIKSKLYWCDKDLTQDYQLEEEILNNIYDILAQKHQLHYWFVSKGDTEDSIMNNDVLFNCLGNNLRIKNFNNYIQLTESSTKTSRRKYVRN